MTRCNRRSAHHHAFAVSLKVAPLSCQQGAEVVLREIMASGFKTIFSAWSAVDSNGHPCHAEHVPMAEVSVLVAPRQPCTGGT